MQGKIGQPHGGFPEPLRSKILKGSPITTGRPGENMPPLDMDKIRTELRDKYGPGIREYDVVSYALYPKVTDEFLRFKSKYGPVDKLPTRIFLVGAKVGEEFEATIEKGKTLQLKTLAVSEDLTPAGEREVFFELNGQLRQLYIPDEKLMGTVQARSKADKTILGHVGAPMPGTVLEVRVKEGDKVKKGDSLVVISAMKMEMVVQAPMDGKIKSMYITKDAKCDGGDLLIEMEE